METLDVLELIKTPSPIEIPLDVWEMHDALGRATLLELANSGLYVIQIVEGGAKVIVPPSEYLHMNLSSQNLRIKKEMGVEIKFIQLENKIRELEADISRITRRPRRTGHSRKRSRYSAGQNLS